MKRFKKIYIEITNVCNLSCNFCPKTRREAKYIGENEFAYILESIKGYTKHIYFHLMGEPFLHPKLKQFLDISADKGFIVNITTNGTLIDKVEDILLASNALRQLNISLSSFEANEDSVGFNEYFGKIIEFLNKADKDSNIICSLRLWNMDSKKLKACNELNPKIFSILEKGLGLDYKIVEHLEISEGIKLKNKIYLNMAEKFEWPDNNKSKSEQKRFCYGLRDHIGILVDGTVVPCCLDSEGTIKLGNLFEQDFKQIIEGQRSTAILNGFSGREAVEDLCKKCGYSERF